jgi:3',5'-cyclic AMP phosphodiesterase CpdA
VVATLLHLSDLHLGSGGDEHFGDHKLEVIAPPERESRSRLLASSLENLGNALRAAGEELDAIVISGDVTYQANPDGLSRLGQALDALGDRRPSNGRVVVVPGNHDVRWATDPGTAERYEAFVENVRKAGFVTPVLEGIDSEPTDLTAGVLTATDNSFVVVALNSADHCGVNEQVTNGDSLAALAAVETSGDAAAQRVLAMWKRASLYDIARVGSLQLGHGSRALAAASGAWVPGGTGVPLRIATFHHQLLPISLDEEIKPFEALTNLAQVRDWFAANDIELLLHGHKHVAHTYEDHYAPLNVPGSKSPRRLLVSSVGTVGLGQHSENTLARLIRVDPARSRLGRIEIVDVPATRPGIPFDLETLHTQRHLVRVAADSSGEIAGATVEEVHEQILERLDARIELTGPLVCRVQSSTGADLPPKTLIDLVPGNDAEVGQWFKDTVEIWQNDHRYSAMPFNHGERIRRYDGEIDLVERVTRALSVERDTSRGVISLLNQARDDIASEQQFPAFCLVQLFINRDGRLVVVGYFRKQEMKYWWPVNVAELAHLQRLVQENLASRNPQHAPQLGEIVTITAIPANGKAIPRVVVPVLDRWVDDEPARLTRMCLALMAPDQVDVAAACEDWDVMLRECGPVTAAAADGSPVPLAGMAALLGQFIELEQVVADGAAELGAVRAAIQALLAQHSNYQRMTRRDRRDREQEGVLTATHATLTIALQHLLPSLAVEPSEPAAPADPAAS